MKKLKPRDDKSIISSEYYENNRASYICSFCNRTLSRLTDAGQNNSMYWCITCQVEFDPEAENLRKESKLIVPDRNEEPAITSIQTDPTKAVEIRHTVPIRGGFVELEKRGIKIKDYHTTEKE
jgi:DNA-directed RNA polymerase subunit RPC12/RpoP